MLASLNTWPKWYGPLHADGQNRQETAQVARDEREEGWTTAVRQECPPGEATRGHSEDAGHA